MAEGYSVMSDNHTRSPDAVGYKSPPTATRFQKGRSGNPKGRPKNRKAALPYDHVLGQMVTIRQDGRERRVTAAEAFLLQLTKKGLEGDGQSMRAFLAAIDSARPRRNDDDQLQITRIIFVAFGPGVVLKSLGMAVKKYPTDKSRAKWELRPWIVEAALGRLGGKTLTPAEQDEVWKATSKPDTINWPEWWAYRG